MKWKNEYCNHINDFTHVECFEGEEWKDIYYTDLRKNKIVDYRGLYQISNLGRIRSFYNNKVKIKRVRINKRNGYVQIDLNKNKSTKTYKVHRLVALTFLNYQNETVNHINENLNDNTLKNLEFCSYSFNNLYGTRLTRIKEHYEQPILGITKNGDVIKFNSFREAHRNGYNIGNVQQNMRGVGNYYKGYKWYKLHSCPLPPTKKIYEKEDDING